MTDTEAIAEMCFEFSDRYDHGDKPTLADHRRWSVLVNGSRPAPGLFHGTDSASKVVFQLNQARIYLPMKLPWIKPRGAHVSELVMSPDVYIGPSEQAIAEWRDRQPF